MPDILKEPDIAYIHLRDDDDRRRDRGLAVPSSMAAESKARRRRSSHDGFAADAVLSEAISAATASAAASSASAAAASGLRLELVLTGTSDTLLIIASNVVTAGMSTDAMNTCVCSNGVPAPSPLCVREGASACIECDSGYHLDGGGGSDCLPNSCFCHHGTTYKLAAFWCTVHNTELCEYCDAGYHSEGNGCRRNICSCPAPTGVAATGAECTAHGAEICFAVEVIAFSFPGAISLSTLTAADRSELETSIKEYLEANSALTEADIAYVFVKDTASGRRLRRTQDGISAEAVLAETVDEADAETAAGTITAAAESGSTLTAALPDAGTVTADPVAVSTESIEAVNECVCPNGTAVTKADCTSHGATLCAACDVGYSISIAGFCSANTCVCPGGVAAAGSSCVAVGDIACSTCNPGYTLDISDDGTVVCSDTDGCTPFSGTGGCKPTVSSCIDVPAPGTGHICVCADGFYGETSSDGSSCASIEVSSTVTTTVTSSGTLSATTTATSSATSTIPPSANCKYRSCSGHGFCISNTTVGTGGESVRCDCNTGFTGSDCEININDCNDQVCNNGTCIDGVGNFTCKCSPGFSGRQCEHEDSPCDLMPCGEYGTCNKTGASFACDCDRGYTGLLCNENIDDCAEQTCNKGTCVDMIDAFECVCNAGFAGDACDIDIDDCVGQDCGYGDCIDLVDAFQCVCQVGYTGSACGLVDYCHGIYCSGHGVCNNNDAGYVCECDPGYTGDICDVDVDDCLGNACVHGTCEDGINEYQCICDEGYSGENCTIAACALGVGDDESVIDCQNGGKPYGDAGACSCDCTAAEGFGGPLCADNALATPCSTASDGTPSLSVCGRGVFPGSGRAHLSIDRDSLGVLDRLETDLEFGIPLDKICDLRRLIDPAFPVGALASRLDLLVHPSRAGLYFRFAEVEVQLTDKSDFGDAFVESFGVDLGNINSDGGLIDTELLVDAILGNGDPDPWSAALKAVLITSGDAFDDMLDKVSQSIGDLVATVMPDQPRLKLFLLWRPSSEPRAPSVEALSERCPDGDPVSLFMALAAPPLPLPGVDDMARVGSDLAAQFSSGRRRRSNKIGACGHCEFVDYEILYNQTFDEGNFDQQITSKIALEIAGAVELPDIDPCGLSFLPGGCGQYTNATSCNTALEEATEEDNCAAQCPDVYHNVTSFRPCYWNVTCRPAQSKEDLPGVRCWPPRPPTREEWNTFAGSAEGEVFFWEPGGYFQSSVMPTLISTAPSTCSECAAGTYQGESENIGGPTTCKAVNCWADPDDVLGVETDALTSLTESANVAKSAAQACNRNIYDVLLGWTDMAPVVRFLSNLLSVGWNIGKFDFKLLLPLAVSMAWADKNESDASKLVPAVTVGLNPMWGTRLEKGRWVHGTPDVGEPGDSFVGFGQQWLSHVFGLPGVGNLFTRHLKEWFTGPFERLAVDLNLDWPDLGDLVPESDTLGVDISANFKVQFPGPAQVPHSDGECKTFCDVLQDWEEWAVVFPEDGLIDYIRALAVMPTKTVPSSSLGAFLIGNSIWKNIWKFIYKTYSVAMIMKSLPLFDLPGFGSGLGSELLDQELKRNKLRHELWLQDASDLEKARACVMAMATQGKAAVNVNPDRQWFASWGGLPGVFSPDHESPPANYAGKDFDYTSELEKLRARMNSDKDTSTYTGWVKDNKITCKMPMYRAAAYCHLLTADESAECDKSDTACKANACKVNGLGACSYNEKNGSHAYDRYLPFISVYARCEVSSAFLKQCQDEWGLPDSLKQSMPETYTPEWGGDLDGAGEDMGIGSMSDLPSYLFQEGQKTKENLKPAYKFIDVGVVDYLSGLAPRPPSRLFVHAARDSRLSLDLQGVLKFKFDIDPNTNLAGDYTCPDSDPEVPVGLGINFGGSVEPSAWKWFHPYKKAGMGESKLFEEGKSAGFPYTKCTGPSDKPTLWKIVLNEVVGLYSPGPFTPPFLQTTAPAESDGTTFRKHVVDVYRKIYTAVESMSSDGGPTTFEAAKEDEWRAWLKDRMGVRGETTSVALPLAAPIGNGGLQVTLTLPDVTVQSILCLVNGVDPNFSLDGDADSDANTGCGLFVRAWFGQMLSVIGPVKDLVIAILELIFFPVGMRSAALQYTYSGGMDFKCGFLLSFIADLPIFGRVPVALPFGAGNKACMDEPDRRRRTDEWGDIDHTGLSLRPVTNLTLSTHHRVRRGLLRTRRFEGFSLMIGIEVGTIGDVLIAAFEDDVPGWAYEVDDFFSNLLPPSMSAAMVISTAETFARDANAQLSHIPVYHKLPDTFIIPAGISVLAAATAEGECAGGDVICKFIESNFGKEASLFLALGIGTGPSISAAIGLGGVAIEKSKKCPNGAVDCEKTCGQLGVSMVEMSEVSVFAMAKPGAVQFGLRLGISFETGKRGGETDDCTSSAMVAPITFIGELSVIGGVVPQIGGLLMLDGIMYKAFGASWMHFADLGLSLMFTPPSVIPSKLEVAGTVAFGDECYQKDDETGAISVFPDPEDRLPACVRATVALGFDANDPLATYFMAVLEGFDIATMVAVFVPKQISGTISNILPKVLLDSGFVGDASVSYAAGLGLSTMFGVSVPAGLRVNGTLNILGYTVMADINIDPTTLQFYIDILMTPMDFGFFQLTAATHIDPDGCVPDAVPVDPDEYEDLRLYCIGSGGSEAACLAAPGTELGPCRWNAKGRGPKFFTNISLGGLIGLTDDPANVDVLISGRVQIFLQSAEAYMRINNTHMHMEVAMEGVFGIPGTHFL